MATKSIRKVWYLPVEPPLNDTKLLAILGSGTLIVEEHFLEFKDKKETVLITNIRKVSCGRYGRDIFTKWVKVEYQDGKTAFFADGSWLGWGGFFGGTRKIFDAVRHLE